MLYTNHPVANDEGRLLRAVGRIKIIRYFIRKWAITQSVSVIEQLKAGIRYFDVRLSIPDCHTSLTGIHVLHALYGRQLSYILFEINRFLMSHKKEVIILDFNHFYNFDFVSFKEFIKLIENSFALKTLTPRCPLSGLSLDFMWKYGYQIIAIIPYHYSDNQMKISWIWGPESIVSPYPNVNRLDHLFKFLEITLKNHRKTHKECFYVTQAILTAKFRDICFHPWSSLKETFSIKCTEQTVSWISSFAHPSFFNIIMCDFINYYNFCEIVAYLNYQLID